jgi:hypothetical protein
MAQSPGTSPTPVRRVSPRASTRERDQKASSLPRQTPVDTLSHEPVEDGLDWESFVATYFPGSRRHNLKALVAYGDYKHPFRLGGERASEATANVEAPLVEVSSVEAWENEGGASH